VSAEASDELDQMIDDYLDGRLEGRQREQFEERMKQDPELHRRVLSATQSVALVQQALGWVTPSENFEEQVNSKIINITQSGNHIRPLAVVGDGALTKEDPDAKLLADPDATRENRRLVVLGIVAVVLFALAMAAIVYSVSQGVHKP
jgi:anti-sigma factor RsiW